MRRLTTQGFWEGYWQSEQKRDPDRHLFHDLFKKYVPERGTYFEVGCAPGTTMVHFARHFGCKVTGIDFSATATVQDMLIGNGVKDGRVINADFLEYASEEQYDVVASYGFVEHFDQFEEVIQKQLSFVKPSGTVIVELPNIRYFNYWLYRIFQPQLLPKHNLRAMDLQAVKRAVMASNEFELLFCNYYFTCFLFFDDNNPTFFKHKLRQRCFRFAKRVLIWLRAANIPTRYFSPYIVLIARKYKAAGEGE